eukprot:1161837-Pelagomonas_calceolata.AAC.1
MLGTMCLAVLVAAFLSTQHFEQPPNMCKPSISSKQHHSILKPPISAIVQLLQGYRVPGLQEREAFSCAAPSQDHVPFVNTPFPCKNQYEHLGTHTYTSTGTPICLYASKLQHVPACAPCAEILSAGIGLPLRSHAEGRPWRLCQGQTGHAGPGPVCEERQCMPIFVDQQNCQQWG